MESASRVSRGFYSAELAKANELRELLHDSDEDDDHSTERTIFKSNEHLHELNKMVLEFSAHACGVDLLADERNAESTRMLTLPLRFFGRSFGSLNILHFRCIQLSDWGRASRRKLWFYLFPLVWLASTLHMSYRVYRHYAFDYYFFRLSRVRWLNQTQPARVLQSYKLESENYLLDRLRESAHELQQIGTPNTNLCFVLQCIYLFLTIGLVIIFLVPYLYYAWISPFDFYFIRNFFDFAREQRRCRQFVHEQVRIFAQSIESWSLALLASSAKTHDGKLVAPSQVGLIDCATVEGSLLCRQLHELLLVGHLRPLNQRAKQVARWSAVYSQTMLPSNVYVLLSSSIFIIMLFYLIGKPLHELDLDQLIIFLDMAYLLTLVQLSVGIYCVTLVFTCLDQMQLVGKLRRLLELTIELNNLRFYGERKSAASPLIGPIRFKQRNLPHARRYRLSVEEEKLRHSQMNRDILLALMHYRIFVARWEKLKPPMSMIATCCTCVMLLMPILGRIHVPYFPAITMQTSRLIILSLSAIAILPADIYLVPVCYLNKRCIGLYSDLNSLLAHVTQISLDSEQSNSECHDSYMIISLLRKELAHHDQVRRQLTLKSSGINYNYETLIRLHFYVGFIMLSMMGENVAHLRELTGTIFSDPLGLF